MEPVISTINATSGNVSSLLASMQDNPIGAIVVIVITLCATMIYLSKRGE